MPRKPRFTQRELINRMSSSRKKPVSVKVVNKKGHRKYGKRNILINRGPSLIPDVYITKMTYSDTKVLDQMILQQNVVNNPETKFARYSGNSIYDPDDTQLFNGWPVGYAEMRHFYEKFYVSSSKIRVQVMTTAGTVADGIRFQVYPSTRDTINGIDYDSYTSNPYCSKSKYVGSAFNNCLKTTYHRISTQSITGKKKPSVENDYHGDLEGPLVNGDPLEQWYWFVICQSINPTFNGDQLRLKVSVTYNVMFYERRQQVQDDPVQLSKPIGFLDESADPDGVPGQPPNVPP